MKKVETDKKKIRKYLHVVMDLVMSINQETSLAGFFNIVGHCEWLEVTIGKDKIKDFNERIYENKFIKINELDMRKYNHLIDDLKEILNENK